MDQPVVPSCPNCRYDLSGAVATSNGPESLSCPMLGTCSECGEEFRWADAFRAINHYFDDLPRSGFSDGLGRSLRVALFPWASRHLPSSPRFSLRRSACVAVLGLLLWHLAAAAWVLVMQLGWLLPWGTTSDEPIDRVLLDPWSRDWGYFVSGTKYGSSTVMTMGGNGVLDVLLVSAPLWLVGLIVLAVALARTRAPHSARLWTRAALRSVPIVGALTLAMSGVWVVLTSLGKGSGEHESVLTTIIEFILMVGPPIAILWLCWSRHVCDLGVFPRPRRVVLAMTLLPILALIALAFLFDAARSV